MSSIGARIRQIRERQKRSAADVSIAAGLSKNTVSDIETNPDRSPTVRNLQRIARTLGVSVVWLLNGDGANDDGNGLTASQVTPFAIKKSGQSPNRLALFERTLATIAPSARNPAAFQVRRSSPGLGYLEDDLLIVDQIAKPIDGDIVIARVTDMGSGAGATVVRRLFSPYLIDPDVEADVPILLNDGTRTSITGVVRASIRAPELMA